MVSAPLRNCSTPDDLIIAVYKYIHEHGLCFMRENSKKSIVKIYD